MKQWIISIGGIVVMGIGGLGLALCYVLPPEINEAEYQEIVKTGLPSNPEKIVWSEWGAKRLDQLELFPNTITTATKDIQEARFGSIKKGIVTFGIFQAKVRNGQGETVVLPAFGPGAFAHMDWWPPLLLTLVGLGVFFFGLRNLIAQRN